MHQRTLGHSGIEVGAIGLGCMGFTHAYDVDQRDDSRSIEVVHRALDLGVTLLDTSDVYGPFTNEELVGRALVGHRERAVVATKCGIVPGTSAAPSNARNGRPEYVRASCDASLRRLGIDVIDLYQLHRVDPDTPLEDTWGAFAELVEAARTSAVDGVKVLSRAFTVVSGELTESLRLANLPYGGSMKASGLKASLVMPVCAAPKS